MSIKDHRYQDLIAIFEACFAKDYNTKLLKGEAEPVYLPANEYQPFHAIYFAYGYFSSALHECAHWLIAGKARRQLEDYGYWYIPDGRTLEEQQQFEKVEVKPQAMEWILSVAAGYKFQFSLDNLTGETLPMDGFKQAVYQQVLTYCQKGLPVRAQRFRRQLCEFYQTPLVLSSQAFIL